MKIFLIIISTTFILFILILGGSYYISRTISQNNSDSKMISYTPVTDNPISLDFNLSTPEDNRLIFSKDILVQGKSAPDSQVIISTENFDEVLKVGASGEFSDTITLTPGVNYITVAAFDKLGYTTKVSRTVYYSEVQI